VSVLCAEGLLAGVKVVLGHFPDRAGALLIGFSHVSGHDGDTAGPCSAVSMLQKCVLQQVHADEWKGAALLLGVLRELGLARAVAETTNQAQVYAWIEEQCCHLECMSGDAALPKALFEFLFAAAWHTRKEMAVFQHTTDDLLCVLGSTTEDVEPADRGAHFRIMQKDAVLEAQVCLFVWLGVWDVWDVAWWSDRTEFFHRLSLS
jgi:hypothetical protein